MLDGLLPLDSHKLASTQGGPQRGGGCIFESCNISLENTPTSHTASLTQLMYTCCDFAMPLLSSACLCNNSKCCLASLVTPSSCTVLLLWCFLLKYPAEMGGRAYIATTSFKKGRWAYFERLRYIRTHQWQSKVF